MARVLDAWVLVWVAVSLTSATQRMKIHESLLNVCVSMGPSLTYQSATYELTTASQTMCAALCLDKGAQRYEYTINGTSCTLYGEGLLPSSFACTFSDYPLPVMLEDIATGKVADASSTFDSFLPSFAVDTIENDDKFFHSGDKDASPWWLLDLGEIRFIYEVQILSRRNCCPDRLHDIEIRVGEAHVSNGDFSSYTLFATYKGPYSVDQQRLSCPNKDGVSGRFVHIAKMINPKVKPLQLADVNVLVRKGTH